MGNMVPITFFWLNTIPSVVGVGLLGYLSLVE